MLQRFVIVVKSVKESLSINLGFPLFLNIFSIRSIQLFTFLEHLLVVNVWNWNQETEYLQ